MLQLTVIRSSGIASTNAMPCSEHPICTTISGEGPRTMAAAKVASDRRHLFPHCVSHTSRFYWVVSNCPIATERRETKTKRSTDTVQKFGAPMSLWDKTGTLRLRNAALTNSVMQRIYYRSLVEQRTLSVRKKEGEIKKKRVVAN